VSEGNETSKPRLPAGRPPWDPINGIRVGGLAGGIAGILLTVVLGMKNPWVAIICAVVGGTAGYLSEKRKQRV
jgi:hypothetical protein